MRGVLWIFLAAAGAASAQETFLLRFGVGDDTGQDWSGRVSVEGGRLESIRGWQLSDESAVSSDGSWRLETRRQTYWDTPWERSLGGTKRLERLSERGVVATVSAGAEGVRVETAQGDFAFRLADLRWQAQPFLNGRMEVSRVPQPSKATDNTDAEDFPDALRSSDGVRWLAWQAYDGSGEQLFVQRGEERPEAITPPGRDLYRVRLAEGVEGRIWAVWSEQVDGDWDLFARSWAEGSWSNRERLTSAPGSDIFPALDSDGEGRLYLVWQSFRDGDGDIYLRMHDGQSWGPERAVSDSPANDWEPDVAAAAAGRAAIVWDGYEQGDYDIWLRPIEGGEMDPARRLTDSPAFEARPSAAFDEDGRLWLAWEEGDAQWGKDYVNGVVDAGMGLMMRRRARVAVWRNDRLEQPAGDPAQALPSAYQQAFLAPRIEIDGRGTPWLFFRYRTNNPVVSQPTYRGMWRLGASAWRGDGWTSLVRFTEGYGRIDSPTAVAPAADGGFDVWWISDGRLFPDGYPREQDLFTASLRTPAQHSKDRRFGPFQPLEQDFPPVHPNEAADVAGLRAYRATAGGRTYRIVRGDMHRHTDLSWDGNRDGSLLDAYRYALDAAAMDYLGVADHDGGHTPYHWRMVERAVDLFTVAGRFAPLYGYERSRPYPSGHRNVMLPARGAPVLPRTPEELADEGASVDHLYRYLRQYGGIAMSHTSATGAGTDWRDRADDVEPLVELYQGYRNNYEHEQAPRGLDESRYAAGYIWNAWQNGLKLGLQSSSDHVSTHASYGMIYVEDVDRRSVLEGIRARRAYAATDNILVDFRVNGRLMGSQFSTSEKPRIEARIVGTAPIACVELIRKNRYIHTQPGAGKEVSFSFVDNAPLEELSWYYIRVEQEDGELAWASPVWVEYRPSGE